MNKKVSLELTKEEAIVLFEYLVRNSNNDSLKNSFEDQSEQRVLWNLEAVLESLLVEPFKDNYMAILQNARKSIMDKIEE